MQFTLIALSGYAGSGKDTVADILRTHLGFTSLAFATALRDEISAAFRVEPVYLSARGTKETPMPQLALENCSDQDFVAMCAGLTPAELPPGWSEYKRTPRSPRQIMQLWGTEYRRARNPDYWVRQVADRLMAAKSLCERDIFRSRSFVVTDCRFPNEHAALAELGAIHWSVQRPGHGGGEGAHVSETSGAEFQPDGVICNDGSIEDLRDQVLSHYAATLWNLPGLRITTPRIADMVASIGGTGGAATQRDEVAA